MTSPEEFSRIAKALDAEAARLGLTRPAFRIPCEMGPRSIRRYPQGVVVRVAIRDRDPHDVTADLVDGVMAANPDIDKETTEQLRNALWVAAGRAVAV